ncbi:MAG: Hypothetical protein AJITA_01323 [Acetilactobacillus jinshanensis]
MKTMTDFNYLPFLTLYLINRLIELSPWPTLNRTNKSPFGRMAMLCGSP